jgi:hypothetical protein
MQTASPRAGRIPADPARCCHLTHAGARCTMPVLRGKDLCYRHGRREKVLRVKPAVPDNFPLAPIVTFSYMEDHDDVMANLNAIADAFSRHAISHAMVSSLTYLMNTALKTLKQMSEIETKITAEEIVRDVTYNDLDQPQAVPDPEPLPESELVPEPAPDSLSAPAPEPQSDPEPGAPFLPGVGRSGPARERPLSAERAAETTPQPTTIHTLNATADPNPIASHTYENSKKQPQSFQTHAENRGGGRG